MINIKVISYFSELILPIIVFLIITYGLSKKVNVYDEFTNGVENGFKIVVKIAPTIVGLLVGVGVLRASGFFEIIGKLLSPIAGILSVPMDIVPLIIVRMFSASAATGLVLDIFKQYGPDSRIGTITSIMMSCTETIFYTMSVYFMAAGVKKTRYTLKGALIATFSGIVASFILASFM